MAIRYDAKRNVTKLAINRNELLNKAEINTSQKFMKHRIAYNSSYANLNPTQPIQNLKKSTQPNLTHGWIRPTANSAMEPRA